ncbi:hypothetical protein AB1Y20_006545 [Prymnesium parvum]|uniref:RING-type domain-containing protein n=1 Tax=Prymnesium parvum TaxID=97485 RepID=A0AB34J219_PRYPA
MASLRAWQKVPPPAGSSALHGERQRRVVSAYQPAPSNFDRSTRRTRPSLIVVHQRDSFGSCYCIHCAASAAETRRRQGIGSHGPSPYLEDLTKRLVKAQPARRKLHLVPQLRVKTTVGSPYESRGYGYGRMGYGQPFRNHLQADFTERQARLLWHREAAAAAERCGVDLSTYTTLLSLQHRDITPEDYDVLQQLDSALKPKTLHVSRLERELPAWRVPGEAAEDEAERGESSEPPRSVITEDSRCSICLEKFLPGQMARTLPCQHFFHQKCIDVWLTESSNVCPADNQPVLPEDSDDEEARKDDQTEPAGLRY